MKRIAFISGFISSLLTIGAIFPAFSQVSSDNTTNTTINQNGNNFKILNGIQKGNNLFHSFKEFSIPTGSSATFQNSSAIVNIINRVTGGNISNIDGLIKSQGNANLFLINPSGIVFGENAKLDIGGSFIGSTAESILFEDGFNYSAIVSEQTPLLTVSVPLGLQMGTNPADIIVNNTGHHLTGSDNTALTNQDANIVGLQVPLEQTFALVGGNLKLDGGVLTAESGRFELSAIGNQNSSSVVGLKMSNNHPSLTYDTVQPAGNIQLLQQALVNASGTGSGTIQIHGGNLTVEDGSVVWLENRGQQAAGSININIANSIDLVGSVPDGEIRSGVYSDVSTTGKGGNLTVYSTQIKLVEGGNLQTRTFGDGDSGNVTVNASNIEFIDTKADFITGVIGTRSFGSFGNSGDITVNTQSISINGGGAITAGNASVSGNSGNIVINASDFVKLSVFASNSGDAIIGASAISSRGNAGNITINARERVTFNDLGSVESAATNISNFFPEYGDVIVGNAGDIRF